MAGGAPASWPVELPQWDTRPVHAGTVETLIFPPAKPRPPAPGGARPSHAAPRCLLVAPRLYKPPAGCDRRRSAGPSRLPFRHPPTPFPNLPPSSPALPTAFPHLSLYESVNVSDLLPTTFPPHQPPFSPPTATLGTHTPPASSVSSAHVVWKGLRLAKPGPVSTPPTTNHVRPRLYVRVLPPRLLLLLRPLLLPVLLLLQGRPRQRRQQRRRLHVQEMTRPAATAEPAPRARVGFWPLSGRRRRRRCRRLSLRPTPAARGVARRRCRSSIDKAPWGAAAGWVLCMAPATVTEAASVRVPPPDECVFSSRVAVLQWPGG